MLFLSFTVSVRLSLTLSMYGFNSKTMVFTANLMYTKCFCPEDRQFNHAFQLFSVEIENNCLATNASGSNSAVKIGSGHAREAGPPWQLIWLTKDTGLSWYSVTSYPRDKAPCRHDTILILQSNVTNLGSRVKFKKNPSINFYQIVM